MSAGAKRRVAEGASRAAAKRLKVVNGKIVLSSLKPHILEVFEIAGFTSIFPVYGDAEQAVQQLQ